jgi:hypothetical protein
LLVRQGAVQGGSKASSAADFKGWGSLPSMGHMAAAAKHQQAPPTAASSENQISEAGKPQHEQLKRYIEMVGTFSFYHFITLLVGTFILFINTWAGLLNFNH